MRRRTAAAAARAAQRGMKPAAPSMRTPLWLMPSGEVPPLCPWKLGWEPGPPGSPRDPPESGRLPRPRVKRYKSPPWGARAPSPPLGRPLLQGMGRQGTAQPGCSGMSMLSRSPHPTATHPLHPPHTLSFGPRSSFGSRELTIGRVKVVVPISGCGVWLCSEAGSCWGGAGDG